jgi:hypothetical protein
VSTGNINIGTMLLLLERDIHRTELPEMPLLGGVNHCNVLLVTVTYIKGNTVYIFFFQ